MAIELSVGAADFPSRFNDLVAGRSVSTPDVAGTVRDIDHFPAGDIRLTLPRFEAENFAANRALLDPMAEVARDVGCTMAQLALAWTLAKAPHVIALPGTRNVAHLEENLAAAAVELDATTVDRLDALINHRTVAGPRYRAATAAEVDTENID